MSNFLGWPLERAVSVVSYPAESQDGEQVQMTSDIKFYKPECYFVFFYRFDKRKDARQDNFSSAWE